MKCRGSIVLEASYVLPLIFLFLAVLLLFAFFKHDMAVFESEVKTYLLWEATEEEGTKEDDATKRRRTEIEGLHYLRYTVPEVTKEKDGVELKTKLRFQPLPFLLKYDKRLKEDGYSKRVKSYRPQARARKFAAFLGE